MTIIKTGLISGERWTFATLNGYCFMVNGKDRNLVYDGVTVRNMGIQANGTAATFTNNTVAGNLAASGAYYYKYTYFCSARGVESNPNTVSALMTSNASGANGIRITVPANASLEPGVDYVKIYRTTDAGLIYYYDGIKAYSGSEITYDSSVSDSGLGEVMGELNDAATANKNIYGLPPTCPYIAAHKGRVTLYGNNKHSTGTVAVVQANATVTGTASSITAGMDGWTFQVDGTSIAYIIGTINVAAQTFVLKDIFGNSVTYVDASNATATYTLWNKASMFYYSHKDLYGNPLPESFYFYNYLPINPDDNDEGSGQGILHNSWFLAKRNNCYVVDGDIPEDFRWRRLETNIGCCSHWTICNDRDGNIIFMHETGVYFTDGNSVVCLSNDIENIFTGKNGPPWSIVDGKQTLSHATFDLVNNRYMLWVCSSDYMDSGVASTVCDKILVFDFNAVDGKPLGWSWWDVPGTCSAKVLDSNEIPQVWFGDSWGFVKYFDKDALNDGVGAGADTRRGTCTSGDTTSVIDSGATFYTTGSGLQGCFVHIIAGTNSGEIRRITTNDATDCTVDPAFSAAIDTTSVYAIGGINMRRKTKIFDYGTLKDKMIQRIRMVFQVASSTYSAFFKMYQNFSTTAHTTKYIKLDDTKGYYEARWAANRAIHLQYEYGLHDVDKTLVIKEVEIDVDLVGSTEPRAKQGS